MPRMRGVVNRSEFHPWKQGITSQFAGPGMLRLLK
jgi:hypothetical protein